MLSDVCTFPNVSTPSTAAPFPKIETSNFSSQRFKISKLGKKIEFVQILPLTAFSDVGSFWNLWRAIRTARRALRSYAARAMLRGRLTSSRGLPREALSGGTMQTRTSKQRRKTWETFTPPLLTIVRLLEPNTLEGEGTSVTAHFRSICFVGAAASSTFVQSAPRER